MVQRWISGKGSLHTWKGIKRWKILDLEQDVLPLSVSSHADGSPHIATPSTSSPDKTPPSHFYSVKFLPKVFLGIISLRRVSRLLQDKLLLCCTVTWKLNSPCQRVAERSQQQDSRSNDERSFLHRVPQSSRGLLGRQRATRWLNLWGEYLISDSPPKKNSKQDWARLLKRLWTGILLNYFLSLKTFFLLHWLLNFTKISIPYIITIQIHACAHLRNLSL